MSFNNDLSSFFEFCSNPCLLRQETYRKNRFVRAYCAMYLDPRYCFPDVSALSRDLVCIGFPGEAYLESRWRDFCSLLKKALTHALSYEELKKNMLSFLASCCRKDVDNCNDFKLYSILFSKKIRVPVFFLRQAYSLSVPSFSSFSYPVVLYAKPKGCLLRIVKKGKDIFIYNYEGVDFNYNLFLKQIKIDYDVSFILSVKWDAQDKYYFNSPEAKWFDFINTASMDDVLAVLYGPNKSLEKFMQEAFCLNCFFSERSVFENEESMYEFFHYKAESGQTEFVSQEGFLISTVSSHCNSQDFASSVCSDVLTHTVLL